MVIDIYLYFNFIASYVQRSLYCFYSHTAATLFQRWVLLFYITFNVIIKVIGAERYHESLLLWDRIGINSFRCWLWMINNYSLTTTASTYPTLLMSLLTTYCKGWYFCKCQKYFFNLSKSLAVLSENFVFLYIGMGERIIIQLLFILFNYYYYWYCSIVVIVIVTIITIIIIITSGLFTGRFKRIDPVIVMISKFYK